MEFMDSLLPDQWETSEVSKKEGFKEYHVTRNHKQTGPNAFTYLIAEEDGDPKPVEIHGCAKNKDPLKNILILELKLSADGKQIIGIDLEGDCVQMKS